MPTLSEATDGGMEAVQPRTVRYVPSLVGGASGICGEGGSAELGSAHRTGDEGADAGLRGEAGSSVCSVPEGAAPGCAPAPSVGELLDAVSEYANAAVALEKAERDALSTRDAMERIHATYRTVLYMAYNLADKGRAA